MRILVLSLVLLLSISHTSCQSQGGTQQKQDISAVEFEQLMKSKSDAQLIDVRTQKEFRERHLKGATLMDINEPAFNESITTLDKSKPVFVYCLGGGRSASAASRLKDAGFTEVYNLKGGILEWTAAGLPVEAAAGALQKKGKTLAELQALAQSKAYVLIDYHAVWCGPCRKIAPILQKFSDERKEQLMLLKIDADENPTLMTEKGIRAIPYIELYKDGKLIWQHSGIVTEEQLKQAVGF
ncbi:MAG: thioredoxin [Bacteroidia bacterium]|nr:thioredoxin [Bacteroidia bacterium]MCC6767813.1 thioredoxin [Bacteroidia bacterium]